MSEKPLHVRVAEALGHEHINYGPLGPMGTGALGWMGDALPPENWYQQPIPRYDTDWRVTGPLIERLKIMVQHGGEHWMASCDRDRWNCPRGGEGRTALEAVCQLILLLHAEGKLAA